MTNDERNPKSDCQKVRLGLVLISDFDHWLFFRHSLDPVQWRRREN